MKIAIIGVGAVGGYFGGLLANAGKDVVFVARGVQYQALKENGLVLNTISGNYNLKNISIVQSISELEDPELVLISTKTYHLESVAIELKKVINNRTIIIPLCNGVDNDLLLKEIIPEAKIYPGLSYIIASRTSPGVITQTAGTCTIFFGERGVTNNAILKDIETLLKSAGILATYSSNIESTIWKKFIWLNAFAGMTALCKSPIGPIVNSDLGFELLIRCIDEGINLAKAYQVELTEAEREEMINNTASYKTSNLESKSSLLVDLENNRANELESLCGTIIRLGKEKGVPTPNFDLIYTGIRIGAEECGSK